MNLPDPVKHCHCSGQRQAVYRTDNRGNTRLVCKQCSKPIHDERIEFKAERVPA